MCFVVQGASGHVGEEPAFVAGSCAYLNEHAGLDPHSVAALVVSSLGGKV